MRQESIPKSAKIYLMRGSDSTQMELAVIILNWNAAADTVRCARYVAAWKRLHPTIWVVDNGSTDGSVEVIARECPDVRLIPNSDNLGFAGGTNRGIIHALSAGDAPILLLNNDAFIEEEDVIKLVARLQTDKQIGFIGPLLFDADQKDRLLAAGGRNPVRYHHSHIYELPASEPLRVVDYVPGTVLLGRPELFRTVGLLDEDYFFTMEVADLCLRARQHDYISAIDTRARAFHALSCRPSHLRETLYVYYIIRNRFLFIRKFYPNLKLFFYSFWTLYSLALSVKVQLSGQPATARAIRLGLRDGLRGRFGGQNGCVLSMCGLVNPA
jgi:GT2 family glycosyltransferase